jgi:alkanesulfonate monooxygenase SsuD/methylene tetrahydromethanopterin reductase-like flavin-dependent oxidoreductase (luciferase family)
MKDLPVYPRAVQQKLPVWIGVGGTPESFVRAGSLGLPLMVAVIGGETYRFRPLIDLYREAGRKAGFKPEQLLVGLHSPGYVGETNEQAIADYYPGYAELWTRLGAQRGWPPVTKAHFDGLIAPKGALVVGGPAYQFLDHSNASMIIGLRSMSLLRCAIVLQVTICAAPASCNSRKELSAKIA